MAARKRNRISRANHPSDIAVGGRVRQRRMLLGWSQQRLAATLGVSFQQVQKYERGANRVSASMLEAVASALDAPIAYFFGKDEEAERAIDNPLMSRETIDVVRGYYALPAALRPMFLELIRAVGATLHSSENGNA